MWEIRGQLFTTDTINIYLANVLKEPHNHMSDHGYSVPKQYNDQQYNTVNEYTESVK